MRRFSLTGITARCITTLSNPFHNLFLCRRWNSSSTLAPTPQSSRKKKPPPKDASGEKEDVKPIPPKRSALHPPKLAPSVWQIFFTDWLEQKNMSQENDDKKINVAQAAKEAGRLYSALSEEERTKLKQRALVLKENYEREFTAWKRTLTPTDIAHENAFRAAQRKSGKSRRKNINDPNAPKRPLGAYFMFLQAIRADPQMAEEVFCGATETTRQSVLAAVRWRGMSDEMKRPYLEQAENAKRAYEAEREAYERAQGSNESTAVTSILIYPASPSSSPRYLENKGDGDT